MKLRCDMHIHSTHSDGRASPESIVDYVSGGLLDCIAVTDHNTFSGGKAAARYARRIGAELVVIVGNEVRVEEGDILVYCLDEADIVPRLPELIDTAHEHGCLVVPAHPFDIMRKGIGDAIYEYRGWDAVEVWNAWASRGANREAMRAAKLLGLPGLANSDAHILDAIGAAYTWIDADEASPEKVLEAIKRGRTKPVPGRVPFRTYVKRILWSIERRVR